MSRPISPATTRPADQDNHQDDYDEREQPKAKAPHQPPRVTHPHAVVVDLDDEDPAFDELDDPDSLRYRRAVGE
ncbi:hypothetical protein ACFQ1S_09650 [Kibdelosporangium lantanae]|uniref:Uncharacterized protein n=1 Tax=Kibdelosporangium lantanae TaxID=1497396 RepID=A0ABW3M950_9PSEU